jgi:cytochrome c556
VAAAGLSCRPPGNGAGAAGGGDTVAARRGAGDHWVQSEKLRAVMHQISRHAERWPIEAPAQGRDPASQEQQAEADDAFRDAAALAEGLAESAKRIPRSVADHPMSEEDRSGFNAEAARLNDQALRLRRAARRRQVEPMQQSLAAVSATCVSCHTHYRDFTGELGDPNAAGR